MYKVANLACTLMGSNNKYNMTAYVSAKKFAFHHVSLPLAQLFIRNIRNNKNERKKTKCLRVIKQLKKRTTHMSKRNEYTELKCWNKQNLRFRKKNSDLVLFFTTQALLNPILQFIRRNICNVSKRYINLLKRPPDIRAHRVEPEKCNQIAEMHTYR